MIEYDSSHWRTLLRIQGSVFPQASIYALVSATLGLVLKSLEMGYDDFAFQDLELITQSSGFSLFFTTLSFVLVFRTSKCYDRFWHCATSVSIMRAQMSEAAGSLVTFSIMSKSPADEVAVFRHTLVRLFSLLHASCLATLCDRETHFELIDVESLDPKDMEAIEGVPWKERVDIVYLWINTLIVKSLQSGLLNVPPPILSRVFQEMEKSMVEFAQVMQVMTIPFPFPYAQMAVVLLFAMGFATPLVMCYWTNHPISTFAFTFIAMVCLLSLEMIADELDNPFGQDDNDLPCEVFQSEMNAYLLRLTTKAVDHCPQLVTDDTFSLAATIKRRDSINSLDGKVEASPNGSFKSFDGFEIRDSL